MINYVKHIINLNHVKIVKLLLNMWLS